MAFRISFQIAFFAASVLLRFSVTTMTAFLSSIFPATRKQKMANGLPYRLR